VVLLTAVILCFYGLTRRFTETIKAKDFTRGQRLAVHALAYAGYISRGVILGITGFFLVKAALENNAGLVVNTDKAFDFIGDHIGHPSIFLLQRALYVMGFICLCSAYITTLMETSSNILLTTTGNTEIS
jgi:hypothetical protein